jgi:tRNA-splicing ligase RtcB
MKCGLNMSFANREVILHRIREVFSSVSNRSPEDLGMHMVYDVALNTAKLERHRIDGQERTLLVHRKGATRAFGPQMKGLPARYADVGQPIILGGSLETGSYLLVGVPEGAQTFFSTAHGSGRTMSRTRARKQWRGDKLQREMAARGIYVRTASWSGLAEEAGGAYKDYEFVDELTVADLAFRAWGRDLEETFIAAVDAVMNAMVADLAAIEPHDTWILRVEQEALDMLLFNFLQELVY